MDTRRLMSLARRVFRTPTAPYAEGHMSDLVRAFAAERRALSLKEDSCGNLIIRYRRGPRGAGPLLAFGAHMDHPALEITGRLGAKRAVAVYRGGGPRKGLKGAKVRIFCREKITRGTPARVTAVDLKKLPDGRHRVTAELTLAGSPAANGRVKETDFAMFDFPPVTVKGGMIHTRACDDPAAVAALLAALDELIRRRVRGECIAFFTRAEETGLQGALVMAGEGALPKRARVVALETSNAVGRARIGGGPVVRVGDRASVFDPPLTHYLASVAHDMEQENKGFRFQRRLMDGGNCEATVFGAFGYKAGSLCLPLGNYHNIGPNGKPAAEVIARDDLAGLVELMVSCVKRRSDWGRIARSAGRRYLRNFRKVRRILCETRQ